MPSLTWRETEIKTDGGKIVEGVAPVIISASRSTDIPAFFSTWMANRLRRGYVRWLNPFKGQRKACGCIVSKDIGMYDTCHHLCAYCYANTSRKAVENNIRKHNPESDALVS